MTIKQMYDDFLEKGELFSLASNLTGEWEKDKEEFTEIYTDLFQSIIDLEDDFEDE